jgi:hypothetical protein
MKSAEEVQVELFADEQHPQMLIINVLWIAVIERRSKIGFRGRQWDIDRISTLYELYEAKN